MFKLKIQKLKNLIFLKNFCNLQPSNDIKKII